MQNKKLARLVSFALLGSACFIWLQRNTLQPTYARDVVKTIALEGMAAPGTDKEFLQFGIPSLNNRGEVAFLASYEKRFPASIIGSLKSGIWSNGGIQDLHLVAKMGDPVPGIEGNSHFHLQSVPHSSLQRRFPFSSHSSYLPWLDDHGRTVFSVGLAGPDIDMSNRRSLSLWRETSAGQLEMIMRDGDNAPDVIDNTNFSMGGVGLRMALAFNRQGQVAFQTGFGDSGSGIWRQSATSDLVHVASSGKIAPGTEQSVVFTWIGNPSINNQGLSTFIGALDGPGIDRNNNIGIWRETSTDDLTIVARTGDRAPGTPDGTLFAMPLVLVLGANNSTFINDDGYVAFASNLTGPGIDESNDTGYWSEGSDGNLRLIVREGDAAPGVALGVQFGDLANAKTGKTGMNMNETGQIAFLGQLTGPGVDESNGFGIWREKSDGNLALVLREGDSVPDLEPGSTIASFYHSFRSSFNLNNSGQLLISALIQGPEADSPLRKALFAEDSVGELRTIAHVGQLFDISDDPLAPDLRTIVDIEIADSRYDPFLRHDNNGGFNDRGQVAFWARFTDGSEGIFISNLAAVPEPSSAVLAMFATGVIILLPRW